MSQLWANSAFVLCCCERPVGGYALSLALGVCVCVCVCAHPSPPQLCLSRSSTTFTHAMEASGREEHTVGKVLQV